MGDHRDAAGPAEPGGPADPVEARLREELRVLAGGGAAAVGPSEARRLVAAGQRRAQRRSVRSAALAAAACLAVVVGGAALVTTGDGQVDSGVTGEGSAPTPVEVPRPPDADAAPSQSPEDAERDRVLDIVAELPQADRVGSRLPAIADGEDVWVASEPPAGAFAGGQACTPASAGAPYATCATEYGEVLLLDPEGRIQRAYPLPGVPPQWLHVTDRYVYAGRQGDGGLPDSVLVRIDRRSGDATVVLLHTGIDEPDVQPDDPGAVLGWVVATPEQVDRAAALMDRWSAPGATGTPVASWPHPDGLRIDFAAVDQLFADVAGG